MDLIVFGAILVVYSGLWWRLRRDDAFLREYVRTSPKALLWRKAFGEERAAAIIRTRLVPLGMVLSVGAFLLVLGSRIAAWTAAGGP